MPKRDLYSILGVPVEAGPEAIKTAYRRLAMQLHPDAGRGPDPARLREVHDAYVVLSDAARRRCYDVEAGRVARTTSNSSLSFRTKESRGCRHTDPVLAGNN